MRSLSLWGKKKSDKQAHRTHEQRHKASLSFVGWKDNAFLLRNIEMGYVKL